MLKIPKTKKSLANETYKNKIAPFIIKLSNLMIYVLFLIKGDS